MSLSVGAQLGNLGRVRLLGILIVKEGSGNGASFSAGALLGEPGGGLLCWGYGRKWGGGLRVRLSPWGAW